MNEKTPEQLKARIKLLNKTLKPLGFEQYKSDSTLMYKHSLLDLVIDLSAINTEPRILMKHILVQFINEGKQRKLEEIQNILGIK